MEVIREWFEIERWVVFGGSWGSTLALAYAETHPERVLALVLRGIFLLRPPELRWFYQDGAGQLFPDAWEAYIAPIRRPSAATSWPHTTGVSYGDDPEERARAARAWSVWEATSELPRAERRGHRPGGRPGRGRAMARIEAHYFVNGGFFSHPDELLDGVDRIRHIPATIVQGRYDVVCPMRTAWDLHALARGRLPRHRGRRPLRVRAGHHRPAGDRHGRHRCEHGLRPAGG